MKNKPKIPFKIEIPESSEPKISIENNKKLLDSSQLIQLDYSKIEKKLLVGQGHQGKVWRVRLKNDKNVFALKEVDANTPEIQEFLKREVDILSRCTHPNIVRFCGIHITNSVVNILMEYMNFGRLSYLLEVTGKLPEPIVGIIAYQILDGLNYMHSQKEKIIHRDLKPSNILLNEDGEVKISDFGISRRVIGTRDKIISYLGTKRYMSPRRLRGSDPYDSMCDIWSFGMLTYEIAKGEFPFKRELQEKGVTELLYGDFLEKKKDMDFPQEFSSDFKDFLSSCLKVVPEERSRISDLLNHKFILKSRKIPLNLFKQYLEKTKKMVIESEKLNIPAQFKEI